jgi:hypothetical protein
MVFPPVSPPESLLPAEPLAPGHGSSAGLAPSPKDLALLDEIARRIADIDEGNRAVAEKVGQLYMRADEAGLAKVTELLDQPMRNVSDNQRSFAALLNEVSQASQHSR